MKCCTVEGKWSHKDRDGISQPLQVGLHQRAFRWSFYLHQVNLSDPICRRTFYITSTHTMKERMRPDWSSCEKHTNLHRVSFLSPASQYFVSMTKMNRNFQFVRLWTVTQACRGTQNSRGKAALVPLSCFFSQLDHLRDGKNTESILKTITWTGFDSVCAYMPWGQCKDIQSKLLVAIAKALVHWI